MNPMITLNSLPINYHLLLNEISRDEVIFLKYHYYDRPRNGVCLYKGKKFWFQEKDFQINPEDREVLERVDKEGVAWNDHYARYLIMEISEKDRFDSKVIGWFKDIIGSIKEIEDDEID